MNTVINGASGKPSNPLRGYSYNYVQFEVTTAPNTKKVETNADLF